MNRNITLRQLRAFLTVSEHGSFTKAAAALNITQSALTTAVKNLESEIGLKLFDRTTRKVELTLHGRQFAAVATRFTDDFEQAIDDLRAHALRQQGQVVAGATATMISNVLVPALSMLSARHPGIRVRLVEELTTGAIERVRSGEVDWAFTTVAPSDGDYDAIPIMRDVFCLVCSPEHPLAKKKGAHSWNVFRSFQTIGLSNTSGLHRILSVHEEGQAAVSQLAYEVSSIAGLTRMVRDGLGIAAVPKMIAESMAAQGVFQAPLAPEIYRTVSLISRPGRAPTPAASALVSMALLQLKKLRKSGIDIVVTEKQLSARGYVLD